MAFLSMAKSPTKDSKQIELEPDAWQRFERAVDVVVKSPPQHRTTKKQVKKAVKKAKKSGK
jgi:hypothetical protein